MTYLFVGAGQAGSAIVDSIFDYTDDSLLGFFESTDISTLGTALAFNSTIRDLENLSNIPKANQYGIAQKHGVISAQEPGFEEKVTGGFGRKPNNAYSVLEDHLNELRDIFEQRFSGGTSTRGNSQPEREESAEVQPIESQGEEIQFTFLFFGLGGGTGCGISSHLARQIKNFTGGRTDIIAVPILPNTSGGMGTGDDKGATAGRQAWNARFGLNRIDNVADGVILVDNQRISYLDSAGGEFSDYNDYIASAFHDIVAGPVLNSIDASEIEGVDTPDIDVQDLVTSLSFGVGDDSEPGYGAIGRSVTMTKNLSGYLIPLIGNKQLDSSTLLRLSTSKLSLDGMDVSDAEKAISLVRAPSSNIGNGTNSIKSGSIKEYLGRGVQQGEVNIGVALSDRNLASVTTILTFRRENIDRIDEIIKAAEQYERETEEVVA